jgi:hypothetical protein
VTHSLIVKHTKAKYTQVSIKSRVGPAPRVVGFIQPLTNHKAGTTHEHNNQGYPEFLDRSGRIEEWTDSHLHLLRFRSGFISTDVSGLVTWTRPL